MKLKFFVINLKRSTERRKLMCEHLDKYGVDYEIFEATDGRALTAEEEQKVGTSDQVILEMAGGRKFMVKDKMSPAEIGCALSHLRLYQHILDQGLEQVVILEDDEVLNDDSFLALNNLNVITEPWDVVHFSAVSGIKNLPCSRKYYFDKKRGMYFSRTGMHNATLDAIFNRRRICFGAVFYVVTPRACEVLLEKGYPVRLVSDYLLGMIGYHNLRTFVAYPMGHYWHANDEFDHSTIGERPEHHIVRL